MNFNLVTVGIAELKVVVSPDILRTILGSCIGICLYDATTTVAGLSHIMLPQCINNAEIKKKYADTAIPILIQEMIKKGADKDKLVAKIIGGATMFQLSKDSKMGNIGSSNIVKVREILKNYNIQIIAEDVGGDTGRTIDFYSENGKVRIKTPRRNIIII